MSLTDPYTRHRDFIAPARDGSPLWVLAAGLLLSDLVFSLSPLLLAPVFGDDLWTVLEGRTFWTLCLSLALYGLPGVAIVQWVRHRHRRSGWSLIGPPVTALRDMWRAGIAVLLVLLAIEILPPFPDLGWVSETRSVPLWLIALPLASLAVLIQCGSEEIIFRGYLQQQLAARSDSPLVWMVVPSALFGLLHFWNAEGAAEGALWALWAFMLGMACADLTARTGTVGAAVGLHTANNLVIFALYGMRDGPDSGFALFLYPFEEPTTGPGLDGLVSPWAVYDVIISATFVLILWLAARIGIRR